MSFHDRRVQALVGSLSVSVLGYNLIENPEGFVVAAMLSWAIDAAGRFAGHVGMLLADMWGILTDAFVGAGGALLAPFTAAGGALIDLITTLNRGLIGIASAAGPAAPIVALLVWAVVTIAIVALLERVVAGVAPWT